MKMDNGFEDLCRFCLSNAEEKSSLSLLNDKILIRSQNKLIDLKKVLNSLMLDSSERELPNLICDICKTVIINYYQLQKTYQENTAVLLGKLAHEGCINEAKDKLMKTVEEFYSEFEDGDELNIIKYKDKLVIEKLNVGESENIDRDIIQSIISHPIEENSLAQFEEDSEAMKEEYLIIDNDDETTEDILSKIDDSSEIHKQKSKNIRKRKSVELDEQDIINKKKRNSESRGSYTCSVCLSSYPDERSASEHISKYATFEMCKTSKCIDCGVLFQSEIMYQKHISYHFLSKMSNLFAYHDCHTCKIIFGTPKDFDQHAKHHSENNEYVYKFEGKSQIEGCEILRRDIIDNIDVWHCGHCDMKFETKIDVNFHLTLFHANVYCPFCKQSFGKSIAYLVNHLKLKHPEKFEEIVFNCSFCNESFSIYHDMKIHEKSCNNKKFSCTHCSKKFALERQLKEHLDSIKGEFKFSCTICKKLFTNKAALTVHNRIHTKDKPYICTFPGCDKSFRTNSQVSAHMDIHSEFKNFKCKYCTKLFQTRGARRVHEKTHYEENICKICDSVFKQRSHLIRHVNSIHKIKCDSKTMNEQVDLYIKS